MIVLIWPLVLVITVVLYGLILITLPFNAVHATVFLFGLIAFWSRLPGVAVKDPSYILYLADFVDLFSLIIAVNLGGFYGGIFALIFNILPRVCGFYPLWYMVIEDGIGQFLVCLIIPFFHAAFGGDILISMIIYTILRVVIILPVDFFLYPASKVQWIIEVVVGLFALFIINGFYAKVFGGFFDGLLKQGVHFSWLLFLFATVIILVFYIAVFRRSEKTNRLDITAIFRWILKKHRKRSKSHAGRADKDRREIHEIDEVKRILNN